MCLYNAGLLCFYQRWASFQAFQSYHLSHPWQFFISFFQRLYFLLWLCIIWILNFNKEAWFLWLGQHSLYHLQWLQEIQLYSPGIFYLILILIFYLASSYSDALVVYLCRKNCSSFLLNSYLLWRKLMNIPLRLVENCSIVVLPCVNSFHESLGYMSRTRNLNYYLCGLSCEVTTSPGTGLQ